MRLIDFYKNVLLLTDEALIHEAVELSEIKTIKHGDYLIRQGKVPTHMCFLLNGILRGFMLDVNGKDMTDCIVCHCGDSAMPDNDFTQPGIVKKTVHPASRITWRARTARSVRA